MNFKKLSSQVLDNYELMTKESVQYQNDNKISCPSKCSSCCQNPKVSATALEMLPLALFLIESNSIPENWNSEICLFYSKGCSVYTHRPTVCRLFGWTQISGKNNDRLSICPKTEKANSNLSPNAPKIELWARKIKELDPSLSQEILPINQALKLMIEKVLLTNSFNESRDL